MDYSHANAVVLRSSKEKVVRAQITKENFELNASEDEAKNIPVPTMADRCSELSYQVWTLQEQLDEAHLKLREYERRVPKEERMVRELASASAAQGRELRGLRAQLGRAEAAAEERAAQAESLSRDKQRLLGALRRYQSPARGPQAQVALLRRELELAETEQRSAQARHAEVAEALREEGHRARQVAQQAVAQLRQADKARRRAEGDNSRLREALAQASKEMEEIEFQVKERVKAAEEAVAEFESRYEEAAGAAVARAEERDSAKTEAANLRDQIANANTQNAELHTRLLYYQELCETQALSLQGAREALMGEKQKRKDSEKISRLEHMSAVNARRKQNLIQQQTKREEMAKKISSSSNVISNTNQTLQCKPKECCRMLICEKRGGGGVAK
mmetsp:Transcript_3090/g.4468  ORF Transcript_3090/g.4468 Transcript_3090/m.4468 type:complete len:391 (+) Transcript_3090:113-1285(+)